MLIDRILMAALVAFFLGACGAPGSAPTPGTGLLAGSPHGAEPRAATVTVVPDAMPTPVLSPITPWPPHPAPSPTPRPPVIFLDAGHGGKDPGAVHKGRNGKVDLIEKDVNLDIAKRVGQLLQDRGFTVVYARETDTLLTSFDGADDRTNRRNEIQARVDKANNAHADLYISIHFNSYNDPTVSGTEVYYCADRPFAAKSKRLAELVLQNILRELAGIGYKAVNRGVRDDYGVRPWPHFFALGPSLDRPSQMPGVVVEALFLSNDAEAALLQKEETRQAIARAYAQAIVAYFQPSPKPGATAGPQDKAVPWPVSVTATATPGPSSTPAVPPELLRGNPAWRQVALTFDAGASSQPTPLILDALRAAGVRATMFLTGEWIRKNPDLVRRIVAAGHEVGNHTFSHPDLRGLRDEDIGAQLRDTARLFYEVTGSQMVPYFRPPFGARDARVLRAAWAAGYRSVYWTLDSGDWREDATPEAVRERVLGQMQNGSIVVLHLGSWATARALPEILDGLQAAGYRLVTISQME